MCFNLHVGIYGPTRNFFERKLSYFVVKVSAAAKAALSSDGQQVEEAEDGAEWQERDIK